MALFLKVVVTDAYKDNWIISHDTISTPWNYDTKLNENKEVMTILWFSDFALEGAISKGSGHWCVQRRMNNEAWYHKQTLKIWDQTEWKQGSYDEFMIFDFALEGAISKGNGHCCVNIER